MCGYCAEGAGSGLSVVEPVCAGRLADGLLEHLEEVVAVVEADSGGDFIDGQMRLAQKPLGPSDSGLREAVHEAETQLGLEYSADMALGITERPGEIGAIAVDLSAEVDQQHIAGRHGATGAARMGQGGLG